MLVRTLTALVTIPVFLWLLYVGGWPLFALVVVLNLLGFREYVKMWEQKGVYAAYGLGSLLSLGFQVYAFSTPEDGSRLGALFALTIISVLGWLLIRYKERTVQDALVSIVGVLYVGWLLSHLLLLSGLKRQGHVAGFHWLAMAFFCTWAADSCAYMIGRAFGRRKLAKEISPKKTVEGAIGGSLGAVCVGGLWSSSLQIAAWQGGLIALLISVIAVMGDLAESALKRHVNVKDSGSLLPGHGGILDRFDSSLFVLPFVYYVARFFFTG